MNRPPSHPRTAARTPRPRGNRRPVRKADALPTPFLYGFHAVRAALLNPARRCHTIWCTDATADSVRDILAEARTDGLVRPDATIVDKARLLRLVPDGAVHQGVVLEAAALEPTTIDDLARTASVREKMVVMVLDHVTDPHNVGAILRSAAAFGAAALIVTSRHAPEVTGVLARVASGAVETVPMVRVVNLADAIEALATAGFLTVGLDEHAPESLAALPLSHHTAFVVGSEGDGLRPKTAATCATLAQLPTAGPVASLNVSNAAAVSLYEWVRQHPAGTGQNNIGA